MAMTQNQLLMVDAITKNDMPAARRAARASIVEDTSKKNAYACAKYARLLDPAINPDIVKLPYKIEGMIDVEHPSESFVVDRYYLSIRETTLFADISAMKCVCDRLAEMRIKRSNSVLLHGVSGTGKTTFGRYVAASFDLPFFYINFANLIDSHLGSTSRNIASVFDYVRSEPCVLMLDEIDTIAQRRGAGASGADGEINRITVTIMQEFDKLMNHQSVIAATNRLDVIDEALLRRFSKIHEVIPPVDAFEAAAVMKALLDDVKVEYDDGELVLFCDENVGKPQSWFIDCAIKRVIKAIEDEVMPNERNDH